MRRNWHDALSRRVLVAALLVLGLILCVAPAALATSTGISGRVSEAGTHDPIAGIEACAFSTAEPGPEEEEAPGSYGCANTGSGGEYTISGLNAGNYVVGFAAPSASSLNYIRQFYEGKALASEAKQVSLVAGAITSGIDAELERGAEISGTVTEAATGAPLEGILVCAVGSGAPAALEIGNCAQSVGGGSYTILGLAGGTYTVFFFGGKRFAPMFYDGKTLPSEADLLTVAAQGSLSGIDAALVPATPSSLGVTTPGLPTGPTSSSPGGLQVSAVVRPELRLTDRRISVHARGRARLSVECLGRTRCKGEIAITVKRVAPGGEQRVARTVLITKRVEISIPAGASESLSLRLDATGDALLRAERGVLDAHLTFVGAGDTVAQAQASSVILLARSAHGRG